ncbi:restriction endonuclease subunit S [Streptococcus mutans]|nr:restriction endonuclease subunit S [Streptococcus mutans]
MVLTKLGMYLETYDERNQDRLDATHVVGISTNKEFIETKAKLDGVNLTSYKVVPPQYFAYVADTSRRGEKISLSYNASDEEYLVSSISTVFKVTDNEALSSEFLFMYFNRPEFDRFSRYNSWGSARETFSWEDMCDIEIDLPPLAIQEKYVAVYQAMLVNQKAYENGLEDLKLVCDAELDIFKQTCHLEQVGNLFSEVDKRNSNNQLSEVLGININKEFMPSKATSEKLDRYKVIEKNQFAYSAMQTGRDETIRIALYSKDEPALVSPAYSILETNDRVLPEYVMMWFSRKEADRYGWFLSDSSIRANLDLTRFYEIEIPLPDIPIQQSIVDIYNAYITRKDINERLKQQIKDLCPILITGAIKEASANA